jgi:Tfp pilus assembly protein PilV
MKAETGYSLIEVVASIMILTIAILPMAGMFDMALKTATDSSNYDKARALANLKMEEAKSLPFNSTDASVQDVKDNFPEAAGTTTAYTNGVYETPTWKTVTGPASADFSNFRYKIKKQYMEQPTASSVQFVTSPTETTLIRVKVIVGWGTYNSGSDTYSKTYTTFGLVTL